MLLLVAYGTVEDAVTQLPENIQTVGHAVDDPSDEKWLHVMAKTKVKRFVPMHSMHNFGSVWDGYSYWRNLFETVQLG
jgi:hypothetical protein